MGIETNLMFKHRKLLPPQLRNKVWHCSATSRLDMKLLTATSHFNRLRKDIHMLKKPENNDLLISYMITRKQILK